VDRYDITPKSHSIRLDDDGISHTVGKVDSRLGTGTIGEVVDTKVVRAKTANALHDAKPPVCQQHGGVVLVLSNSRGDRIVQGRHPPHKAAFFDPVIDLEKVSIFRVENTCSITEGFRGTQGKLNDTR